MLKPGRRAVTVLTTDDHSTVVARRHSNAKETRSLAIFLGQAGLVVTAAATALLFLVI
jgi:hypothetical protein